MVLRSYRQIQSGLTYDIDLKPSTTTVKIRGMDGKAFRTEQNGTRRKTTNYYANFLESVMLKLLKDLVLRRSSINGDHQHSRERDASFEENGQIQLQEKTPS